MFTEGAAFDYEAGYAGSVVLSLFRTSSSQLGAGRRKRSYEEGGTGAEVELSFRSSGVKGAAIDAMFDTGNVTDLVGASKAKISECSVASLEYNENILDLGSSHPASVPVGMKVYLNCVQGQVMDRTIDKTKLGLGVRKYYRNCILYIYSTKGMFIHYVREMTGRGLGSEH